MSEDYFNNEEETFSPRKSEDLESTGANEHHEYTEGAHPSRQRFSRNPKPAGSSNFEQRQSHNYNEGGYNSQRYTNQGGNYNRQGDSTREGYRPRQNNYSQGGGAWGKQRYSQMREPQGDYSEGYRNYSGSTANRHSQGNYTPNQGGYANRGGGYTNRQAGSFSYPNRNNQTPYSRNQNAGYSRSQGGGYTSRQDGGAQRSKGFSPYGGPSGRSQNPYDDYSVQRSYGRTTEHGDFRFNRQNQYGGANASYATKGKGKRKGFGAGTGKVKRRIEYKEDYFDPNEPMRLNKFLANAGVCSRRDADKYIEAGVVSVNGEVVTELGTKVLRNDVIKFHDNVVKIEKKVYVLLNKPKGYVTTSEDPQNRKTVMDLVKDACPERIYPVGRLDRNTTGVLLLTNDGELASKLTHPRFLKKKIYQVTADHNVSPSDMQQIAEGVTLDDGDIKADAIEYIDEIDKKKVGIEIHSGKNRIVRRIFEMFGYHVVKLDRVYFAGLTKKNVRRGDWRYLTEKEVNMLRMGAFE